MSGISDRLPGSTQLECPDCKASITIYTYGQARYVGCTSCHRLYKYNHQNLVHTMQFNEHGKFILPLGTQAKMEKGTYILTGIAVKHIPAYKIQWTEYLFFNPLHGYLSLSENSGHWMLMEVIRDYPRELSDIETSVVFRKELYHLINRDLVQTKYAVGEFPSQVHSPIKADEFIRPPMMLAREKQADCHEWYLGKYLQPDEVQKLFKENISLPQRIGIGSAQPSTEKLGRQQLRVIWAIFGILMIVLAITLNNLSTKSVLLRTRMVMPGTSTQIEQKTFLEKYPNLQDEKLARSVDSILKTMNPDQPQEVVKTIDTLKLPIVTESFEVEGTLPSNIEAHFSSGVHNDWTYAECYLINDNTGETRVFWQDIEYYEGVTDGEHWTEGSTAPSKTISSVKPGKYHLNIEVKNGSLYNRTLEIELVAHENILSNFFICLVLFSLLPAALLLKHHYFEKKRWMNSDYSPYESDE